MFQAVFVVVFSRVVAQCVRAGLVEGTKIHADSSLVAANASLNSVRELDAVTLDQIQRACREQTEKLDETGDTKRDFPIAWTLDHDHTFFHTQHQQYEPQLTHGKVA